MKTVAECVGCMFRQLDKMAVLHGIVEEKHAQMVRDFAAMVPDMDLGRTPPELSRAITDILQKHTGKDDPYLEFKRIENERAKKLMPSIRDAILQSSDPLGMAVKFSAAANVIDYGVPDMMELEGTLEGLAEREFAEFDVKLLRERLEAANNLLIVGDNTGEVFFDRLLIEQMPNRLDIKYAVRSTPVINDVLLDDAMEAGIHEFATVFESGSRIPGTVPSECSDEFKKVYEGADVIISKGQGNFETLSDEGRPIFFLFAVKCDVVAGHTGHPKGSLMAMSSKVYPWSKEKYNSLKITI